WAGVHPDDRGRGIGSALLGWTGRTARAAGAAEVRQTLSDLDTTAQALLSANGYARRWRGWLLEYRMDAEPPAKPEPADGIVIRPFDRPADERVVHQLIQEAFGEWNQHVAQPFEQWRTFTVGRVSFDARLSPVAVDSGAIVG